MRRAWRGLRDASAVLAPGEKADFVRFRWDDASRSLDVIETIVAGITVYKCISKRNGFAARSIQTQPR